MEITTQQHKVDRKFFLQSTSLLALGISLGLSPFKAAFSSPTMLSAWSLLAERWNARTWYGETTMFQETPALQGIAQQWGKTLSFLDGKVLARPLWLSNAATKNLMACRVQFMENVNGQWLNTTHFHEYEVVTLSELATQHDSKDLMPRFSTEWAKGYATETGRLLLQHRIDSTGICTAAHAFLTTQTEKIC